MTLRSHPLAEEAAMSLRHFVAGSLVLALAALTIPAEIGAQPAAVARSPETTNPRIAPLSPAANQVRQLLDLQVEGEAVTLGAELVQAYPNDAALHALYSWSLWREGHWKEARTIGSRDLARWPDDAWAQAVRGYLLLREDERSEAFAAAARARQLAPDDVDIAVLVMQVHENHQQYRAAIALADSFIDAGRATATLRAEKAEALLSLATLPSIRDHASGPLAEAELERALAEEPPSLSAYLRAGQMYASDRRHAKAWPLLERAKEMSPGSANVRRWYWQALSARPDLSADERKGLVQADMEAFLEFRNHSGDARLTVARYLQFLRDTVRLRGMWELMEREHAGTTIAAEAAYGRAMQERRSAWAQASSAADSLAASARLAQSLREITAMPGISNRLLGDTYYWLFDILRADSTSSGDELVELLERREAVAPWPRASDRHVRLPVALAERRTRLDLAEELARSGLDALEDDLAWSRPWMTVAEAAVDLERTKSTHHSTIGWVLYHKGDVAGAKQELLKAHEALNSAPTPPYRLGRIAEAEGDIEEAERWYATGRGRETWEPKSSDALKRLYLSRHDNLEGFDEYLADIDARDLARRQAKAMAERIAEPTLMPAFELEWMNGGQFNSKDLAGKVAVINFWGVWCGPCVAEAPEIQKFAEQYRDHPDVVFLTVANDMDAQTTRDFMLEKGYDFPVILDEGFVRAANVNLFPTTIFVDREGKIAFEFLGSSLRLVDEYGFRVEALLEQRTTVDGRSPR
jgi:thiol-disulfide isomerase/thioredoxin